MHCGKPQPKTSSSVGLEGKWRRDPFENLLCCQVASVVSDSVQPQRRQPTGLPRPWDSPGKNAGAGCHFLLRKPAQVAAKGDPSTCSE